MTVGADFIVGVRAEFGHECCDCGVGVLDTGRTGEDQRHTRFVDEHGVGFVDDDDIAFGHPLIGILGEEPVAEHIESDLGHRSVDDLGAVGLTAFVVGLRTGDRGRLHTEEVEQRLHPVAVTDGEVVVDADDVHASTLQRVAGCRQGTDEGLALTGGHLHDAALQQSDESAQLCVIGAFVEDSLTGFARQCTVADERLLLSA